MKHVLSAGQFTKEELARLFELTDELKDKTKNKSSKKELAERYKGEAFVSLFYEPSTRTRLSFEIAAGRFGMAIASTENAREFSSAAKGETIEDTIKVLNEYQPAIIVMRHHETGSAERAASVSKVPIINAGDGKGEHPTQALLDLYTIQDKLGRLDNLRVVIGGDLANGRTARSLAKMLTFYGSNHITFVSTPELAIGDDIKKLLSEKGISFAETGNPEEAFQNADIVYWTRLQKERIEDGSITSSFVVDDRLVETVPEHAIILHPLPRVGEISTSVDNSSHAAYFEQAGNGMYVRMALIDTLLG